MSSYSKEDGDTPNNIKGDDDEEEERLLVGFNTTPKKDEEEEEMSRPPPAPSREKKNNLDNNNENKSKSKKKKKGHRRRRKGSKGDAPDYQEEEAELLHGEQNRSTTVLRPTPPPLSSTTTTGPYHDDDDYYHNNNGSMKESEVASSTTKKQLTSNHGSSNSGVGAAAATDMVIVQEEAEEGEEEEEGEYGGGDGGVHKPTTEEEEYEMEEDIYTLMFAYGLSWTSMYGFVVVLLQLTISGLFFVDITKDSNDGNALNVPAAVDPQVLVAQFLALPLAIMTHEDCTTALYLLGAQYDSSVRQQFPNATSTAWYMALFLRFLVGFVLVFISFLQIVQASTLTDLFLNLEAIVFVGNIDNFAFWLADKNFLFQGLQHRCHACKDITFHASHGVSRTIVKRLLMFLTLLTLVIGFAIVARKQNAGAYLDVAACNSFDVAFGDWTLDLTVSKVDLEVDDRDESIRSYYVDGIDFQDDTAIVELLYSSFSGTYRIGYTYNEKSDTNVIEIRAQRAVYYEEIPGFDQTFRDRSLGTFYYCAGAWLFTVEGIRDAFDREDELDEASRKEFEECGRWLLRSPPTEEFFLENVPTDNWRIWTGAVESADGLSISCNDCQSAVDCNYFGECVDKKCQCSENRVDPTCSVDPPCSDLQLIIIGETTEDYQDIGDFGAVGTDGSVTTDLDNLLLVYGRPVYKLKAEVPSDVNTIYIYYLGSRWNVAVWTPEQFDISFINDIPAHSFYDQLFADAGVAISEPTRNGSPFGLRWEVNYESNSRGTYGPYLAREESRIVFDCKTPTCTGDHLCGFYGECVDGQCVCNTCFGGYFCEFSPVESYALDAFIEFLTDGHNSTIADPDDYNYEYYLTYWSDVEDPFVECCEVFGGCRRRDLIESTIEDLLGSTRQKLPFDARGKSRPRPKKPNAT